MTVTPPEHNVIRIVEPIFNGQEKVRKLSIDEHYRLMGFKMTKDYKEIKFPPGYQRIERRDRFQRLGGAAQYDQPGQQLSGGGEPGEEPDAQVLGDDGRGQDASHAQQQCKGQRQQQRFAQPPAKEQQNRQEKPTPQEGMKPALQENEGQQGHHRSYNNKYFSYQVHCGVTLQ